MLRPLIANIDQFFITFSAKSPDLDFEKLNLMLLNSFYVNMKPVVIINKIELLSPEEVESLKEVLSFLTPLKIEFFFVSTYNNYNIEPIKALLENKLSAFGGPSGVGKSSLLNLLQTTIELETGEISQRTLKGKHTTKETSLIKISNNGYLADTPGFSFLDPPFLKNYNELISLFPDFDTKEDACHFKNCIHINEPKCAVKKLLLDGVISSIRYDFYKKMYSTFNERWSNYD